MAAPLSDTNLLFGVLALQMDFIDRDSLVESMNAWMLDKSQLLGDILVAQGKLTAERCSLLSALVQEHLKQHDNDPEKSLLALDTISSVQNALQEVKDPDIQQSLTQLSSAAHDIHATHADVHVTLDALPPPAAEGGQRFRILRPHAKGGLGQVSVAVDKELHREVALKELQMRYAGSEDIRERFLLEAEVTGGLEHPGIVPVYGLGHYDDGRPFYAMRFIRGDNLKEAIERFHKGGPLNSGESTGDPMTLRKLLRRFIDVCDAIHYAHNRGILHRDLKPGNIMLGKYGETLVVDWGLAKPIGQAETTSTLDDVPLQLSSGGSSAPTVMGSVVGTPSYMSPEQAAGRLDLLGPASDVYGLGATLYHLLTGQPPFNDETIELLQKVERGEFERPRKIRQSIDPGMEAICLKAMQHKPEDRYDSAFQLAEDVEHWLADEPISARRDSLTDRAGRWMRHHRTFVRAAGAVTFVIIVVLLISAVMIQAAHQREKRAFEQARRTVDHYFTDVSETELLNQPNMQTLRGALLTRALEHYEQFIRQRANDASLQDELGQAQYRVGLIKELTSTQEAIKAFQQAAFTQSQLVDATPNDRERRHRLGVTLTALGRNLHTVGAHIDATVAFQDAIELREQLAKEAPEQIEYARTLANSHMNLGMMHFDENELADARERLEKAHDIRRVVVKQNESHYKLKRDIGIGLFNLANLDADEAKTAVAAQRYNEAKEHFETLLGSGEPNFKLQELTALCYQRLADLSRTENFETAIKHYQKALQTIEPLAAHNKNVRRYQATHGNVLVNLAGLYVDEGRLEEATPLYLTAQQIFKGLFNDELDQAVRIDLATTQVNLGSLYLSLERPNDAVGPLTESLRLADAIAKSSKAKRHHWILAKAQHYNGLLLWSSEQWSGAAKQLEAATETLIKLTFNFPEDKRIKNQLSTTQAELRALYLYIDKLPEDQQGDLKAEPSQRADELLDRLTQLSKETNFQDDAAHRLRVAARLHWVAGKLNSAHATMTMAHGHWQKLAEETPDYEEQVDFAAGDLAGIYLQQGKQLLDEKKQAEALNVLKKAREFLTKLTEKTPDDEFYRRDLAEALRTIQRVEDGN